MATAVFAVILCGVYPVLAWIIAEGIFPYKANGSLIVMDGRIAGSSLLAQGFRDAKYFHPRPSSAGNGYDALNSGGSNLGPISGKLIRDIEHRSHDYRAENGLQPNDSIPADAVTASGSGLDSHISFENALLQVSRVAMARNLNRDDVRKMVIKHTEDRTFGLIGEPRVNVLLLNLDLDGRH